MSKTTTKERIIAGGVAIFMLISTVGMYVTMVLSSTNNQPNYPMTEKQKQKQQELLNKYMEQVQAKNDYMKKIGDELSSKYYSTFSKFKNVNQKYEKSSISKVANKDLIKGDGKEIATNTEYQAYYIGWLADGTIFDSSFDSKNNKLLPPITGENLITGWKEGVIGMKIGGVREISIPSNKAYGDKEKGKIPANSPLKFVVMAIPPMTEDQKANMPKVSF